MGWQDFYRRRDALDAAVEQGELRAGEVFGDERELLLALHHRWTQRLSARVELATVEADRDTDLVDAVGLAWRRAAEDNAALRELLDAHAGGLRSYVEEEHRMLATAAGLAEPSDSAEEVASIGAAFVALQRTAPGARANPVGRLFRRLMPSA